MDTSLQCYLVTVVHLCSGHLDEALDSAFGSLSRSILRDHEYTLMIHLVGLAVLRLSRQVDDKIKRSLVLEHPFNISWRRQ